MNLQRVIDTMFDPVETPRLTDRVRRQANQILLYETRPLRRPDLINALQYQLRLKGITLSTHEAAQLVDLFNEGVSSQ